MPRNEGGDWELSRAAAWGIGIGLTLSAAAAGGAYWLYGENGPRNRQKLRNWANQAKRAIRERMDKIEEWNRTVYPSLMRSISRKYPSLAKMDPEILSMLVRKWAEGEDRSGGDRASRRSTRARGRSRARKGSARGGTAAG